MCLYCAWLFTSLTLHYITFRAFGRHFYPKRFTQLQLSSFYHVYWYRFCINHISASEKPLPSKQAFCLALILYFGLLGQRLQGSEEGVCLLGRSQWCQLSLGTEAGWDIIHGVCVAQDPVEGAVEYIMQERCLGALHSTLQTMNSFGMTFRTVHEWYERSFTPHNETYHCNIQYECTISGGQSEKNTEVLLK